MISHRYLSGTEIIEGWRVIRQANGVRYWARPGKDGNGISATTGFCKSSRGWDLLAVFSTNAYPFEIPAGKTCGCYSKFAAFAILHHTADFKAAAKALAEMGYGELRPNTGVGRGGQEQLASAGDDGTVRLWR